MTATPDHPRQNPAPPADIEPLIARLGVLAVAIGYFALFVAAAYVSHTGGRGGMIDAEVPVKPIMYAAMGIGLLSAIWILSREFQRRHNMQRWAGSAVTLGLILANGPYIYSWYIDSNDSLLGVYPLGLGTLMLIAGWGRYIIGTPPSTPSY